MVTTAVKNRAEGLLRFQAGVQSDLVLAQSADVVDLIDGVEGAVLHADFLALIEHGKTTEQNGSGRQRSDALIAVVLLGNVVPSLFFHSQNAPFLNESILILSRLSSFFFHNFFCQLRNIDFS